MKSLKTIISAALITTGGFIQAQTFEPDRTELPIKPPMLETYTTQDVRNTKAPEVFKVTAPENAPNVVIIMLDDNGFGSGSTFGGVIATPEMDEFAKESILYNHFHTTALCSPTRQALKTGQNHHTVNQGTISETATSYPGYTGQLPSNVVSIATILNYNGYSTGAFGKWHETAAWEISPAGPMTRWPNQQGFDEFYGFMGGETNQWRPNVYHNQNRVEIPEDPNYHFMNDVTTQAIEWVQYQKALAPDKPYFLYFTPGAVHAPHHVPQSYIDKQKGNFDEGWDVIRQRTYEQQKAMGIIPQNAKLAPKPQDIKDWVDLSPTEQKLFARQAEVFAAFLDMSDHEIGRLLDALEELGDMDNTLVFYITGDNGTSAEGGMNGMYNEFTYFNGASELNTPEALMKYYDEWGSPSTFPHMAAGWAVAFDSPFTWTKQVASNYGGTRNGLMIKWPEKIKPDSLIRTQWHHVIDIAPTILEACNIPQPKVVDGIPQIPMAGTSMLYTFEDPDAADRHLIQYFELFGNRGLYYDGWFAGTVHSAPWKNPDHLVAEDTWFLYHVEEDFSMTEDLAAQYPEKLAEMQSLFREEAIKYHVYPLDDRKIVLFDPAIAGRPSLMENRDSLTLHEGMNSLMDANFLNIKNRSWQIESSIVVDNNLTQGVIIQEGGRFGGWSLYSDHGYLTFTYNYLGFKEFSTAALHKIPAGKHTVKMVFDYDGGGRGKGGKVTLYIDDKKVGTSKIPYTQPLVFSGDETINVGQDKETMVSSNYNLNESKFNQKIEYVTVKYLD